MTASLFSIGLNRLPGEPGLSSRHLSIVRPFGLHYSPVEEKNICFASDNDFYLNYQKIFFVRYCVSSKNYSKYVKSIFTVSLIGGLQSVSLLARFCIGSN